MSEFFWIFPGWAPCKMLRCANSDDKDAWCDFCGLENAPRSSCSKELMGRDCNTIVSGARDAKKRERRRRPQRVAEKYELENVLDNGGRRPYPDRAKLVAMHSAPLDSSTSRGYRHGLRQAVGSPLRVPHRSCRKRAAELVGAARVDRGAGPRTDIYRCHVLRCGGPRGWLELRSWGFRYGHGVRLLIADLAPSLELLERCALA